MFARLFAMALLALGFSLAGASQAQAANRIEGFVTYASNFQYGYAVGATVEVVNASTGQVVDRRTTDYRGAYTAFSPAGRYSVRATYLFNGRRLTGTNCCVWFSGTTGYVRGVNVQVR